jgi:hypothetical protein
MQGNPDEERAIGGGRTVRQQGRSEEQDYHFGVVQELPFTKGLHQPTAQDRTGQRCRTGQSEAAVEERVG